MGWPTTIRLPPQRQFHLMTKANLKNQLLLGFSLILLVFVAVGVNSYFEIKKLGDLTRAIYNHPLKVSNASLRANSSLVKMHRSMKDVVLYKDSLDIEKAINAVSEEEKIVFEQLNVVRDLILGSKGQGIERKTRGLFINWKPIREEVIRLVKNGEIDKAVRITQEKG